MLRHDPLAPLGRAKVADWHQEADLRRLRCSAKQSGTPSEPTRVSRMALPEPAEYGSCALRGLVRVRCVTERNIVGRESPSS